MTTNQTIAMIADGNNIEMSIHEQFGNEYMINYVELIKQITADRNLSRLIYCREGRSISEKLARQLRENFHGEVMPCYKSADSIITWYAAKIAPKVDCMVFLTGDQDFTTMVRGLKLDGCRVEIYGVENSMSHILQKEADYCGLIDEKNLYKFKK